MNHDAAIVFEDVWVSYHRPSRAAASLKDWVVGMARGMAVADRFQALSGVSVCVPRGAALGVVGPNGAGKSTFLRVACGILTPERGSVLVRGIIAPIIELGTGFDPELTGIENVYFNGAVLGRSRREMRARLDEIVDFAELGRFIDAPLRTYSTGMVARLAFAVATAVDAEVLLLDEILAVGDEVFRVKCQQRIDAFRARGATVVLVTHDLAAAERMCSQALLLEHGKVLAEGRTGAVVRHYRRRAASLLDGGGDDEAAFLVGSADLEQGRCSRRSLSVRLVQAMYGLSFQPPPAVGLFADVAADDAAAPFIEQLAREGVVAGYRDGMFHPDDPVTRAQLCVLTLRASRGVAFTPSGPPAQLVDVQEGYWAAPFIWEMVRDGVVSPRSDNRLFPDEAVTESEMVALVSRAFDLRRSR